MVFFACMEHVERWLRRSALTVHRARLAAALLILAAWQALASSGLLFRDVVPSLWRIAAAIAATLTTQAFYANLRVTAVEFAVAIAIGSMAGVVVGLATRRQPLPVARL